MKIVFLARDSIEQIGWVDEETMQMQVASPVENFEAGIASNTVRTEAHRISCKM